MHLFALINTETGSIIRCRKISMFFAVKFHGFFTALNNCGLGKLWNLNLIEHLPKTTFIL